MAKPRTRVSNKTNLHLQVSLVSLLDSNNNQLLQGSSVNLQGSNNSNLLPLVFLDSLQDSSNNPPPQGSSVNLQDSSSSNPLQQAFSASLHNNNNNSRSRIHSVHRCSVVRLINRIKRNNLAHLGGLVD